MGGRSIRFIVIHFAVLVFLFFSSVPIPEGESCLIEPGGGRSRCWRYEPCRYIGERRMVTLTCYHARSNIR